MSFNATPTRTYTIALGTSLNPYLRVKEASTGVVSLAGATEIGVGTLENRVLPADTRCTVRGYTAQGTQKMVASAAIAAGAAVYTAASGKVVTAASGTTGSFQCGIAATAAGADGDIFEVQPVYGQVAHA